MPFAQLVATWPSLLLLLALPWVAALLAALAQGLVHKRLLSRARTLSQPARRWLAAQALGQGMQTRIEVHAALAEAYFPHADTVGLSPRAAGSAHPVHRAVVAHELGHAATAGLHPLLRGALPAARLATDGLPFAVAAALLTGALLQSPGLLLLALGLGALTLLAHGVVLADESLASLRAWTWLRDDAELTAADRTACGQAMLTALGAYAAPALAWLALLVMSPLIASIALSGPALPPAEPLDATGTWLLLFLGPTLALHAGLVLVETVRPEPVKSAFQLELRQQRQHQWGFMAGICALVVALAVAGWGQGLLFEVALAMAIFVGLEPASVLLRAVLVVPVMIGARLVGAGPALESALAGPDVADDRAPPKALASLWESPPWFLRGARLLQLAWLPLVVLVVIEAVIRVA